MGEQTTPHAVIVGAGIGGLAAANALSQRGWRVTVLERAPVLGAAGACLGIAPNGLRALDAIGLGDAIRTRASQPGQAGVLRPDGRWITRTDVDAVQARFGDPIGLVHRRDLLDLLAGALPTGSVRTGMPVAAVDPGDAERRAQVTSGTEPEIFEADLVVAADGLRSVIRHAVFPQHPGTAYAGYTTWRFVADAVPGADSGMRVGETWGRGTRFAALPLSDGRFYCYATANHTAGLHHDDNQAVLRQIFGSWHEPIPTLIDATAAEEIIHTDVHVLAQPLPAFHVGRVALLGDAAHPMTPDLGQGGCQALEDAVVLAHLLAAPDSATVPDCLAAYSDARRPRTQTIARRSQRVGAFSQADGPVRTRLRDAAVRLGGLLPASMVARGLDPVLGWRPPTSGNGVADRPSVTQAQARFPPDRHQRS